MSKKTEWIMKFENRNFNFSFLNIHADLSWYINDGFDSSNLNRTIITDFRTMGIELTSGGVDKETFGKYFNLLVKDGILSLKTEDNKVHIKDFKGLINNVNNGNISVEELHFIEKEVIKHLEILKNFVSSNN